MPRKTKMPVLFLGHGSPMNIVEENAFTLKLRMTAQTFPLPKAILVISAHWVTQGTYVSINDQNGQEYDFFGFPKPLYEVRYEPPGSPDTVKMITQKLSQVKGVAYDIDHGAWSVLYHLYPEADIPLLQLSIDMTLAYAEHYQLGETLAFLRESGVLIIGSGNVTHNLGMTSFSSNCMPPDWAEAFDLYVHNAVMQGNTQALIAFEHAGVSAKKAHPTVEHYLPLLYAIGASENDSPEVLYEGFQNGSVSMRSYRFG